VKMMKTEPNYLKIELLRARNCSQSQKNNTWKKEMESAGLSGLHHQILHLVIILHRTIGYLVTFSCKITIQSTIIQTIKLVWSNPKIMASWEQDGSEKL